MRKRYRVLTFAALVAALVVPVGYALSIDTTQSSRHRAAAAVMPAVATATTVVMAPVVIHRSTGGAPEAPMLSPFNDAAKLVGIGTVLFGLAAAVRKAV